MSASTPTPSTAATWLLACTHCDADFTVPESEAGQPHRCARCQEYLILPKERLATGAVIGDFILRQTLGRGGRGRVFAAYQRSLDRRCAVKILHPHYAERDGRHAELVQEARLAARLNHPHIVQCYAVGEAESLVYYAMEYVDGQTLQAMLHTRLKLAPYRALGLIRQVILALDYAWRELRIVHRDIKPDNIMITPDGVAKLADFGLARPVHEIALEAAADADLFSGTPQYMSPEQILGEAMDQRSDMYSLGVVLYLALTGKPPFTGASPEAVLHQHLEDYPPYPNVHDASLPPPLCHLVMTLLAKAPDDRFADYETLLRKVDACITLCPDPGSSTIISRDDLLAMAPRASTLPTSTPDRVRKGPRTLKVIVPAEPDAAAAPAPRPAASPAAAGPATPPATAPAGKPDARGRLPLLALGLLAVLTLVGGLATLAIVAAGPAPVVPAPPAVDAIPDTPVVVVAPPVLAAPPDSVAVPPPPRLVIAALLPDPTGWDAGHEWVELQNHGATDVDLDGWRLQQANGASMDLRGRIAAGQRLRLTLDGDAVVLKNSGDRLRLLAPDGREAASAGYRMDELREGQPISSPRP